MGTTRCRHVSVLLASEKQKEELCELFCGDEAHIGQQFTRVNCKSQVFEVKVNGQQI